MARPSHRLTIRDKQDGTTIEVGACWPATRKDGSPIVFSDGTQPINVKLGNNSDKDAAEVYLVVVPKGGQKYKVTAESHFISLLSNTPPGSGSQQSGEEEDDDF